jgi:NAD(P)-dependent dehydrogenase (short-subunit alcohol dehydrogenase family)
MDIEGSTILVTGASSGIGAALAPMLAARGATVGIVARRRERLEQVLAACREHSPGSRLWAADLGDLDRAVAVVEEAWEAFGGLDCVVHNAAIPKRVPVQRLTPELVDETMRVNFTSPVRMTLTLLPRWLERGSGCTVFVSSMGGRIGIAHEAAYCASKFALAGWSESMAIDLHGTGVTVKLALPGPIETEIWDVPGNDPALYTGPFVPAADCAASIIEAIEDDGFEYYVPPEFPGGLGLMRDMVVGKTSNTDAFIDAMGAMAAGST